MQHRQKPPQIFDILARLDTVRTCESDAWYRQTRSDVASWSQTHAPNAFHLYFAKDFAKKRLKAPQKPSTKYQKEKHSFAIANIIWENKTRSTGIPQQIAYGWYDTPFGDALICLSEKGICGLAFSHELGREKTFSDMHARWQHAQFRHTNQPIFVKTQMYQFNVNLPIHMMGTPLQIDVWKALLTVPEGALSDYTNIAQNAGHPKAIRAVASCIGKNPVSWIIPCHRILRKSGDLGGYHWGQSVKRLILAYEGLRQEFSENGTFLPITKNSLL